MVTVIIIDYKHITFIIKLKLIANLTFVVQLGQAGERIHFGRIEFSSSIPQKLSDHPIKASEPNMKKSIKKLSLIFQFVLSDFVPE